MASQHSIKLIVNKNVIPFTLRTLDVFGLLNPCNIHQQMVKIRYINQFHYIVIANNQNGTRCLVGVCHQRPMFFSGDHLGRKKIPASKKFLKMSTLFLIFRVTLNFLSMFEHVLENGPVSTEFCLFFAFLFSLVFFFIYDFQV